MFAGPAFGRGSFFKIRPLVKPEVPETMEPVPETMVPISNVTPSFVPISVPVDVMRYVHPDGTVTSSPVQGFTYKCSVSDQSGIKYCYGQLATTTPGLVTPTYESRTAQQTVIPIVSPTKKYTEKEQAYVQMRSRPSKLAGIGEMRFPNEC